MVTDWSGGYEDRIRDEVGGRGFGTVGLKTGTARETSLWTKSS
jgi:hypothetical protein